MMVIMMRLSVVLPNIYSLLDSKVYGIECDVSRTRS